MRCCFCGGKMIWQNDFMIEDFGGIEDGIVSIYCCSECNNTSYNVVYTEEEE